MKKAVSSHVAGHHLADMTVSSTTDEDEPFESEMFESRQLFLNYCQTTHCQFDELRRAKHSTVMVLFQLHNPMAPKFLQQCGACYRDITHGMRYHCKQCSNFDLCDECYEPVTTGIWAKRDSRFAHEKKHTFNAIDMEAQEESQKIRAERQKTLMAHVELLEHAGTCPGAPDCSSQNCLRLKKLFEHVSTCTIKPKKECRVCTRLLALCTLHARLCTTRGECSIPFCDRIRERNKRLRRQQQLMDDRRRQAQNELYHAEEA
jgi:E1A/CREB-binding protein